MGRLAIGYLRSYHPSMAAVQVDISCPHAKYNPALLLNTNATAAALVNATEAALVPEVVGFQHQLLLDGLWALHYSLLNDEMAGVPPKAECTVQFHLLPREGQSTTTKEDHKFKLLLIVAH